MKSTLERPTFNPQGAEESKCDYDCCKVRPLQFINTICISIYFQLQGSSSYQRQTPILWKCLTPRSAFPQSLNPLVHVVLAWVCFWWKGEFDIFQEVASLQRLQVCAYFLYWSARVELVLRHIIIQLIKFMSLPRITIS